MQARTGSGGAVQVEEPGAYQRMVKVFAILAVRLCWALSRSLATVATMAFMAVSSLPACNTWYSLCKEKKTVYAVRHDDGSLCTHQQPELVHPGPLGNVLAAGFLTLYLVCCYSSFCCSG